MGDDHRRKSTESSRLLGTSPQVKLLMRRSSSGNGSFGRVTPIGVREGDSDLREHLRHLGPSNAANNPKATRITTVKIKPSVSTIPEAAPEGSVSRTQSPPPMDDTLKLGPTAMQGGIGEGLLHNSGKDARDGIHALATSYGSIGKIKTAPPATGARSPSKKSSKEPLSGSPDTQRKIIIDNRPLAERMQERRSNSSSTVGSIQSTSPRIAKSTVRSGSISENVIDVNGVKKMVLDVSSSSDSEEQQQRKGSSHSHKSRQSQDSHRNPWGSSSGHSGYVNVEAGSSKQPEQAEQPEQPEKSEQPEQPANTDGQKDEGTTGEGSGNGDTLKRKKRKKRAGKKKNKGTW